MKINFLKSRGNMRFLTLVQCLLMTTALLAEQQQKADADQPKESLLKLEHKKDGDTKQFDASKGFADIVEKILPSVVSVQATQVVERGEPGGSMTMPGLPPMGRMGPGNPLEELFREFMGQQERPRKMQAVGAGFIVHCDGKVAHVVTNHHVVSEAKTLVIVLEDKTEIPGTLLASDERNDVAVVKLDLSALPENKRNLPIVEWADSKNVRTGDWVIAIGNPFNLGGSVNVGVVSRRDRYVPSGMQQDFEYIQHSAQINVGSSGGALFDVNGKVIGVNNAIITNTGGNIGIGFAIPSNVARHTVDQLITFGKTRRGQLGIRIQELNEAMAESQGVEKTGVIVGSVIDGGPSEGKLELGDIILEYEGKKVTEPYILSGMVGDTKIGSTVTLKIWRKGKTQLVKIKVEEMPDSKKDDHLNKINSDKITESINIAGLEISKIPSDIKESIKETNKDVTGVIVVKVDSNSSASDHFMKGDIIEEANHKKIETPNDLEKIVTQAKKDKKHNILLFISRGGKPAYLPLCIDEDTDAKADKSKKDAQQESKQEPERTPELTPPQEPKHDNEVGEAASIKSQKSEQESEISPQEPSSEQPKSTAMKPNTDETLANNNKSALKDKNNDSMTSWVAKKIKSIFGSS